MKPSVSCKFTHLYTSTLQQVVPTKSRDKQPKHPINEVSNHDVFAIRLDNSEYNRNGDFAPSRWDSQNDAATNICDVKMQQNPENTLAIMSMAGNR